ncbi:hypothetical protein G7076_04840 [Sphingomonas sp. HDW15A]|uniref:PepSY domain-containing protein n=1 Tax=Sphingomonas sp. HDW15A TaxID=2714942 RepID=UPI00140BB989|nr:PepSY domain-containing protein [Sphingomonas sp. HDW15A]QIK95883.1 hypothetical protein G7076_04840 [Sphingomonas sp. HDW15A]
MTIKSVWLRKIHKWVGLAIGLQFVIWAISGTAMALLPMDEVAGGQMADQPSPPPPSGGEAWINIQKELGDRPITKLSLRALPQGPTIEVATPQGVRLFDAENGRPIVIDAKAAKSIAVAAHPSGANGATVVPLKELVLSVREHELPIWQIDFTDEARSSYFVSGTTGEILERRNDSWRWWDFFWMLHNMDYANRTSFNHPLIITVGFAMAWLAVTGFWLLFRTMWRHDFVKLRRIWERGSPV